METLTLSIQPFPTMEKAKRARPAPPEPTPRQSPEEEPSAVLLMRASKGDDQALNDLCARYMPRLQRWAHGRLPQWARGSLDTHDLVQDTLVKVYQKVSSFEPRHEGAFQGYVRQALLNRVRDEIRKVQRHGPIDPLDTAKSDHGPSPLEEAIGQEALGRYEAALERLRPEDRDAIILRIELGLPFAEVAEALGKPSVAAAHMAVSRALVRLAEEMSRGRV